MNFNTKDMTSLEDAYVDGRIYYQKMIDRNSPTLNITELKYIDPRKIKRLEK